MFTKTGSLFFPLLGVKISRRRQSSLSAVVLEGALCHGGEL
jgi:hypothetical protein